MLCIISKSPSLLQIPFSAIEPNDDKAASKNPFVIKDKPSSIAEKDFSCGARILSSTARVQMSSAVLQDTRVKSTALSAPTDAPDNTEIFSAMPA